MGPLMAHQLCTNLPPIDGSYPATPLNLSAKHNVVRERNISQINIQSYSINLLLPSLYEYV